MPGPERRQGAMVRLLVGGQIPKGHIHLQRLRQLARAGQPHAVAVEQNLHQHHRMIRGRAPPVGSVALIEQVQAPAPIQLIDHLRDEAR